MWNNLKNIVLLFIFFKVYNYWKILLLSFVIGFFLNAYKLFFLKLIIKKSYIFFSVK